jgi:protein involved in polysaccharide export with SLBB domain
MVPRRLNMWSEEGMSTTLKKLAILAISLALVLSASAVTVFAQEGPAAEIIQAPKSDADRILDEIDEESELSTVGSDGSSTDSSASSTTYGERITAYTTLFIDFGESEDLDPGIGGIIPDKKIFEVDVYGFLTLDHIGRFKLSGLTADEAELRLSAEPILSDLDIEVSILPVEQDAQQVLQVFGQSIFETISDSASTADIPVPEDYVIGPGDEVFIQFYGATNSTTMLVVTREGVIDFPEIGPVNVAGQTFSELRKNLARLVEQKLIGVDIYTTLGELRSINVLVVGEVNSPGSYTISALSSVIDVLAASGGINDIGSFRFIKIKRGSREVASIDLYNLLLEGTLRKDFRFQSGDVVFVPAVKQTVRVSGEVRRPAIYELAEDNRLGTVLRLAGGLTPMAMSRNVQIERVATNNRVLIEANSTTFAGKNRLVMDGDQIHVAPVNSQIVGSVYLFGEVFRDGGYAWSDGMTVTDVIPSARLLKKNADLDYLLVKRQLIGQRNISVFSVNLSKALANKRGPADFKLAPNDEIYVFDLSAVGQRQYLLSPVLDRLKKQASIHEPAKLVSVTGGVFEPGTYPLTPGMRISDLLTAAGNLNETAIGSRAELTRIVSGENGERAYEHFDVRLEDIITGGISADLELQSYDALTIRSDSQFAGNYTVEITGEVKYPGFYPIARGELLSNVITRAGGLNDIAFAEGAVFSRLSVKEKEALEVAKLADALEKGMKATILERADENLRPGESSVVASDVVDLLRSVEPPGRLVIDFPRILEESEQGKVSDADVMLFDGDTIHIPPFREVVTVVGEVNRPTTHLYQDDLAMMDYVNASGGLTTKTDTGLIFVVRADGSAAAKKTWWRKTDVKPGDTVVVPLDVEKIRNLKKWLEISGIVANFVNPTASLIGAAALWKTAEADQQNADTLENSTSGNVGDVIN